ncbi:MAG: bacteriohemerythrin [Motiliproteus sp.]|nr:bacteriohemerythrin [Motiliproteus sp.]MCW9051475.1 bacteriohemerythrin [Motiliproteus sp.]
MALFNWNTSFETGHQLIDEQHQNLVRLINELDREVAVELHSKASSALLKELMDYTVYHFSCEEELMANQPSVSAEHIELHQAAHQKFIAEVTNLAETGLDEENTPVLFRFLVEWLIHHILKTDKQLVDAINQRPRGVAAENQLLDALHESENRFRALADSTPAMLWLCDPEGKRSFFNESWLKYTGATLNDVSEYRWQTYIHPEDLDDYLALYQRAVDEGIAYETEFRVKNHSGEFHWIHEKATPRMTGDENPMGLNGSCMDISALKEAEELQRSLNEELQRKVEERTIDLKRKNNQLHSYQDQLEKEKAEQAQLIRQLQDAQQQLVQSEKLAAIGHLAAGVAHEINNPIGYVKSNISTLENYASDITQLLQQYMAMNSALSAEAGYEKLQAQLKSVEPEYILEDLQDLLSETHEGLNRVQQIVKDLKDFSRIDNNDWQLADVHECLDTTLNVARNELKYKAEIRKEYGDLPQIECLPMQLAQVFMNLLVNAGQAIKEKGTITLRTHSSDDQVTIEIEDSGVGIPESMIKDIFDPFFTTKPVGKGTGLGLSISYSIIQKHGGTIDVESTPDVGTCFKITLPKDPKTVIND